MMLLYVRWCRSEQIRDEPRSPADEPGTVCFGMADAHGLVSTNTPRASAESSSSKGSGQVEMDSLSLYFQKMSQIVTYRAETWQILNQSTSGFMCLLREPSSAIRISHSQLIAVQRKDSKSCRIGVVQWLRINESNEFRSGIRIFPGEPLAVMVRLLNLKVSDRQDFEPALLLPEVAAPASPATISLPVGWFQPDRMIQFNEGQRKTARLVDLVESNNDFERCTFVYTDLG